MTTHPRGFIRPVWYSASALYVFPLYVLAYFDIDLNSPRSWEKLEWSSWTAFPPTIVVLLSLSGYGLGNMKLFTTIIKIPAYPNRPSPRLSVLGTIHRKVAMNLYDKVGKIEIISTFAITVVAIRSFHHQGIRRFNKSWKPKIKVNPRSKHFELNQNHCIFTALEEAY